MDDVEHWSPEQEYRLSGFGARRSVDVHCHCLPGLDDGPDTIEDSVTLCQELVRDGITTVIATPHQLGRYDRDNSAAEVRQSVELLNAELKLHGIVVIRCQLDRQPPRGTDPNIRVT
mgnify:CR=1 FL=1